jgi:hypothetical protein
MNAMLEPKIVAANIHGWDARAHGATVGRARITPSSHGAVKIFATGFKAVQAINHVIAPAATTPIFTQDLSLLLWAYQDGA